MDLVRLTLILLFLGCLPGFSLPAQSPDTLPGIAFTDDRGVPHSFSHPPSRIIVLSPALAEWVYALGAGPSLIGRSRHCLRPPDLLALPSVGGGLDPDPEAVLSLRPDLLLFSGTQPAGPLLRLESAGLPLVCFRQNSLADLCALPARLGALLGRPEAGAAATARLAATRDRLARESAALPPESRPRVLLLFNYPELLAAGRGSFAAELIALAGGANAADGFAEPWPNLSPEAILVLRPDIVLLSTPDPDGAPLVRQFLANPRWRTLPAVANARVHPLESGIITVPGPGLLAYADSLRHLLHTPAAHRPSPPLPTDS